MQSVFCAAVVALMMSAALWGQASKPAHTPAPWKRYCQPPEGFCFKYPGWWKMLGDAYEGNGVVLAPTQPGDQAFWDEITVAMVAPPPAENEGALSLDGIIEEANKGMREAGQSFQTLQRQQRTVDAKPAELVKAQYRDKVSGRDWVEELVFVQGPDDEIYSVALKCAPQNVAKLEPIFNEVLRTWTLPVPEPSTNVDGADSAPSQQSAPPQQAPK